MHVTSTFVKSYLTTIAEHQLIHERCAVYREILSENPSQIARRRGIEGVRGAAKED